VHNVVLDTNIVISSIINIGFSNKILYQLIAPRKITLQMKNQKKLREKIFKGVQLAIEKLIALSAKNDDSLVFYQDGKIMKIKARELKQG